MSTPSLSSRLAVCSWSLQPGSATELFAKLADIGLDSIQIGLDPIREERPGWRNFARACARAGIRCVSGMFGTVGEDYSTLESIRRTGGLVPDATWEQNWKNIQSTAVLAEDMGLKLVTFHAGFLPHEESDPDFQKLLGRITQTAHAFAARGMVLGFETGQEEAGTLRAFLEKLNCPNVGVNFDPANMILYDKGDPVAALRTLGPWLKQCHLKDARHTRAPGTWGEEVVVGAGEVDWRAFFGVLDELNFAGNCCIEREAGVQRVEDIRAARLFVTALTRPSRKPKRKAATRKPAPRNRLATRKPKTAPRKRT